MEGEGDDVRVTCELKESDTGGLTECDPLLVALLLSVGDCDELGLRMTLNVAEDDSLPVLDSVAV